MVTERALNNGSRTSMWIWMSIGLLLALSIRFSLIDETIELSFEPRRFLPVWTAFMTYHFGRRALYPLLIVLVPMLVTIRLDEFELETMFMGDVRIAFWLGHRVDYALIAVFTALVFWSSAPLEGMNAYLAHHWRWSVFLAFVTLEIVVAAQDVRFAYSLSTAAPFWSKAQIHPIGTAAAAIVGATALRYTRVVSYFQRVSPRLGVFLYALAFGLMLLGILVLPVEIGYRRDEWGVRFDGLSARACLYALSFVLVAAGAFNLRQLLGLTALTCVISFIGVQALTAMWPVSDAGFHSRLTRFLVWWPIRYVASPALLGAMTVPYWSTRDATQLTTRRTTMLLAVVLSLEFVAKPAVYNFSYDELVLGGLAFVSGLIWGGRATIAVPIALQLCVLLSYYALFDSYDSSGISWPLALTCMRLGALAFPFAFFGLLARRAAQKVAQ